MCNELCFHVSKTLPALNSYCYFSYWSHALQDAAHKSATGIPSKVLQVHRPLKLATKPLQCKTSVRACILVQRASENVCISQELNHLGDVAFVWYTLATCQV